MEMGKAVPKDLFAPGEIVAFGIQLNVPSAMFLNDLLHSHAVSAHSVSKVKRSTVLKHKSSPFISPNAGVSQPITWFRIALSLSFPEASSPLTQHH